METYHFHHKIIAPHFCYVMELSYHLLRLSVNHQELGRAPEWSYKQLRVNLNERYDHLVLEIFLIFFEANLNFTILLYTAEVESLRCS